MKLINGDLYGNKQTSTLFTLVNDYDGVHWYLRRKTEHGVIKTSSMTEKEMKDTLINNFAKINHQ